ncbi:MAG: hypothetical protein Q8P22_02090 [Chloroflexota bacterium]|nr:hypothetical protein [Chloroflexota bacterium]
MWELYLPEYYLEQIFRPQQEEAERKAARKARLGEPDNFRARLAKKLVDIGLCLDAEAAEAELVESRR